MRQLPGNDLQKIGPWNDDPFVDVEPMFAQPRLAREIGGWHVVFETTSEDFCNAFVLLHCEFAAQHRDGIGAEIKVITRKGPQWATVSTAGSYLSSSDKRAHFGLGSETTVQQIEILWPSGIRQTLSNIRADETLDVAEPGPQ